MIDGKVKGLYSAPELLRTDFPPSHTIIHGLLKQRETVLLVGKAKMGKSRMLYQLCTELGNGGSFFGYDIPRPVKVLYISIEDGDDGAKFRLREIGGSRADNPNISLYSPPIIADNEACLTGPGVKFIESLLREKEPDVLIVDPLRLFAGPNFDEKKTVDVLRMYSQVSAFKKIRPNLATIIVHHSRKTGADFKSGPSLRNDADTWIQSASGSYSLICHVETAWGFDREPSEGGGVVVFNGVARNWRVPCFLLKDDGLAYRRVMGEELARSLMNFQEQTAWDLAKAAHSFTLHDLSTSVQTALAITKSQSMKVATRMIKAARDSGVLIFDGNLYFVAPAAELPEKLEKKLNNQYQIQF